MRQLVTLASLDRKKAFDAWEKHDKRKARETKLANGWHDSASMCHRNTKINKEVELGLSYLSPALRSQHGNGLTVSLRAHGVEARYDLSFLDAKQLAQRIMDAVRRQRHQQNEAFRAVLDGQL